MSEFPGKGPAITAACCYKETMWAVLGLHTHTHTHIPVRHTYIHMNVTDTLHARKYSSHTNMSHVCHTHTYVIEIHVYTHTYLSM